MNTYNVSFGSLAVRTVVVHTVTYFVVGLLALVLLGYARLFSGPDLSAYMRPTDDVWVLAGPLFQPIRGVVFASVFYVLREPFFGGQRGWVAMWWTLVAIGIISTFGPAPASLEGLVYTRVPWRTQLIGLPEGVLQSLLLSVLVWAWVRRPKRRWLGWLLSGLFVVVVLLSTLGLLVRDGRPN